MESKHFSAVRSMAEKCLLDLVAHCACTASVKGIAFLQTNDRNEYEPAVHCPPQYLLRLLIQ
jgi:hypothetical protein